jgi:Fe-S-cluster containining protein
VKDGPLRRVVKWVARTSGALDLYIARRLGPPARYRLSGSCNGCGKCCEAPSIQLGRWAWRLRSLKALTVAWHRVVNGFVLTREERHFRILTFRCTHYDPVTRQCDAYESRPLMCRDYPVNLTHAAVPELFTECGYRVVDKRAAELRQGLIDAGVAPDKLAQIEEKLFLKE